MLSRFGQNLAQETISLLRRPIRNCKIAHEGVTPESESSNGDLDYEDECSYQHGGCPHLWQTILSHFSTIADLEKSIGEEFFGIKALIKEVKTRLMEFDREARIARTGISSGKLERATLPPRAQREENVLPVIQDYETFLADDAFEQIRTRAIRCLQSLLSQES